MYKTLLLCVHAWFMGWSCITAQRSQGLLGDEVCSVYFGRGSMADEATAFRVFLSVFLMFLVASVALSH